MDKFQVIQSGFVNNVTSKLGLLFKNKNNNKTNKLFKHEFDGNSAELFLFFLWLKTHLKNTYKFKWAKCFNGGKINHVKMCKSKNFNYVL